MGKLFLHMGVFAVVSLAILGACFLMIRLEEQRTARKGPRL